MTVQTPPSIGAKDLQDLKGVSRSPAVALLQKQAVPCEPRPKDGTSVGLVSTPPANSAGSPNLQDAAADVFQSLKLFATGDWGQWIKEYLRYRFGPKHSFLTYDGQTPADGIFPLVGENGEIRIGLAGDWRTGTDEAHRVATLIADAKPHYTVHLGDVYFVGDLAEVRENFLGEARKGYQYTPCQWPAGSKAAFALNGNHEMYARGLAYFDEILPVMGEMVDGKPQGQAASYFCLKNEDWCVIGLDTGYNSVGKPILENIWSPDASLPTQIVDWLKAIAPQIEKQAIILLSHHQVLSAYDTCYTRQADQLFAILKRPVLWFWGHEHRLALYAPFEDKARGWPTITGRCIGHGGMPIDLPGAHKQGSIGTARFVDERVYHNDERLHVGINGFASLTLKGDALRVDYVDVYGQTVYREDFKAFAGAAVPAGAENFHLTAL